jgi:hypothetical protein
MSPVFELRVVDHRVVAVWAKELRVHRVLGPFVGYLRAVEVRQSHLGDVNSMGDLRHLPVVVVSYHLDERSG